MRKTEEELTVQLQKEKARGERAWQRLRRSVRTMEAVERNCRRLQRRIEQARADKEQARADARAFRAQKRNGVQT